jgi:hypothetical protein
MAFLSRGSEGLDGHAISTSAWKQERQLGGQREWDLPYEFEQALEALWRMMTTVWHAEHVTLESDERLNRPDEPGGSGTDSPIPQLRVSFGGSHPGLLFESLREDEFSGPTYRAIVDGAARPLMRNGRADVDLERALKVWDDRLVAGEFSYDTDDTQY